MVKALFQKRPSRRAQSSAGTRQVLGGDSGRPWGSPPALRWWSHGMAVINGLLAGWVLIAPPGFERGSGLKCLHWDTWPGWTGR